MTNTIKNSIFHGVVYRYINSNPSSPEFGWCYVGNTLDENTRRSKWKNLKTKYGGEKITKARERVGLENFNYEVLDWRDGTDKEALKKELDALEEKYITKYNSTEKGYNTSHGGAGIIVEVGTFQPAI